MQRASAEVVVGGVRTTAVAAGLSTTGVLPVFLFGGVSVFVREDLLLDGGRLGALVALFFLASSASSIPGGRFADRTSVRGAVTIAAALSGIALLLGGSIATSFAHWAGMMVLAGLGNGIAQPTSSLLIARGVARPRQGIAFGVKQASIPFATLVVGTVVAVIAVRYGWRVAFFLGALIALSVILLMPSRFPAGRPRGAAGGLRGGDVALRPMLWLAAATGLGAAYGTFLASFFVTFVVDTGFAISTAGRVLTAASIAGILTRLGLGLAVDRMGGGHLALVGRLVVIGSLGFAGFGVAGMLGAGSTWRLALLVGSALIAFTAGWSWTPVLNYAVVQLNPNAPGAASAITQVGVFIGGVLGPALFGAIVGRWSFAAAWSLAVLLSIACTVTVGVARRLLHDERDAPAGSAEAREATGKVP